MIENPPTLGNSMPADELLLNLESEPFGNAVNGGPFIAFLLKNFFRCPQDLFSDLMLHVHFSLPSGSTRRRTRNRRGACVQITLPRRQRPNQIVLVYPVIQMMSSQSEPLPASLGVPVFRTRFSSHFCLKHIFFLFSLNNNRITLDSMVLL